MGKIAIRLARESLSDVRHRRNGSSAELLT
jgi:hypothetical protein